MGILKLIGAVLGVLVAAAIIEDGALSDAVDARYRGWSGELGTQIMSGHLSLADLHERTMNGSEPLPVSGRQERLERVVAAYIDTVR